MSSRPQVFTGSFSPLQSRISSAIEKPVRYVNVAPEDHKKMLLEHGVPSFLADGVYELFTERRGRPDQPVLLRTHELFGVRPTTFAEFALRNAGFFNGGRP